MTKRTPRLWLACLLLLLGACAAKDEAGSTSARRLDSGQPAYAAGEYIVTTVSSVDAKSVGRVYAAFGVENVQVLGRGRFLLRLSRDPGLEGARAAGIESGKISAVQPNFVYQKR